jgi:hypothetical protein
MLQGNKGWKKFPQSDRIAAMQDTIRTLQNTHLGNRIFSVVIEKGAAIEDDPVEFAFEQLCNRFDRYLGRLHKEGNSQRGLLIVDESKHERRFQKLARNFSIVGHRWGVLRNLSEVPLFVDSRASRLIQLADLISYGVFRYYEKGDDRFFPLIEPRLDRDVGQTHGLVHWKRRYVETVQIEETLELGLGQRESM